MGTLGNERPFTFLNPSLIVTATIDRRAQRTDRLADVFGIEDRTVKDLKIGTVAGVVTTQRGPVVIIMHQTAIFGVIDMPSPLQTAQPC